MRPLLRAAIAAAVVAGAGGRDAVAFAGPSQGSIGVRLVDVPERQRDDARARLYIVADVRPGQLISRRIGVSNQTLTPLAVDVYPGAARLDGDQFVALEPGATNELTTWASVAPARVTVDAGAEAIATVTIAVPDDATPGDYSAVVWAQPPPNATGGVTTVNRVGVRVYLSVSASQPAAGPRRSDPDDGSDAFPWLVVALPVLAILVGVGAARAARRR